MFFSFVNNNRVRQVISFILGISIILIPFFVTQLQNVNAQSDIEKLRSQISDKNNKLTDIEQEIERYKKDLQKVGAEKNSLQKAINKLELERKKVRADISYTQNRIGTTDLEISKLNIEIEDTSISIKEKEDAIREILRRLRESDDTTMIETLLNNDNLSEFWGSIVELENVRNAMGNEIKSLVSQKILLIGKKTNNTKKRGELVSLKEQYSDQNIVLENNKYEKNNLLTITKNDESAYQVLLREKETARKQLLREVEEIESQIQFILDPNTIPKPGTAVFKWPLDNPRITQYFGYTKFALSGAYNGSKHNGMDLGATTGTKIYAPLTGTVRNTGDTDLIAGCYSWGKWALIDHPNGLSTLFAHMSQVAVSPGQKVKTGDIVGYVGNTGYSTGSHLHYTLYVTAGVEVLRFNQFKTTTGCGPALSPFAAIEAYLDPIDYLPKL